MLFAYVLGKGETCLLKLGKFSWVRWWRRCWGWFQRREPSDHLAWAKLALHAPFIRLLCASELGFILMSLHISCSVWPRQNMSEMGVPRLPRHTMLLHVRFMLQILWRSCCSALGALLSSCRNAGYQSWIADIFAIVHNLNQAAAAGFLGYQSRSHEWIRCCSPFALGLID